MSPIHFLTPLFFIHCTSAALRDPTCGVTNLNHKEVLNGRVTKVEDLPWMVLLEYKTKNEVMNQCVGFLINARYALTLKLCLEENLESVRLGDRVIKIEKQIPSSNDEESEGIALLRLSEEIQFTDTIKPICLPDQDEEVYVNEKLIVVSGWLWDKKLYSVPVVPLSKCSYEKMDSEGLICAGGESERDSCVGDAGGPLMRVDMDGLENARWYATGVVYMGPSPCGKDGVPSVYVKVSKYVKWIEDTVEL